MRMLFLFVFLAGTLCTPGTQIFAAFSPENSTPARVIGSIVFLNDSSGSGNTLQNIAIVSPGTVCESAILKLKPSTFNPEYRYEWILPNGVVEKGPNYSVDKVTLSDAGFYKLRISYLDNTVITETELRVKPLPSLVFEGETKVCEHASLHLTATADEEVKYSWWKGQVAIRKTSEFRLENIRLEDAGTYLFSAKKNGCVVSKYFTVEVKPSSLRATISANNAVCENEPLELKANNAGEGATYSWSGPSFSGHKMSEIFQPKSNQSGIYTLTLEKDGCQVSDQVQITVKPTPAAIIKGSNEICEGSTLQLAPAIETQGVTYTWILPGGGIISSKEISIANISAQQKGNYLLKAELNGCSDQRSAEIIVKPFPQVHIEGPATGCEGETIVLKAACDQSNAIFRWEGDSVVKTGSSLVIDQLAKEKAGTYQLNANLNGCESNVTHTLIMKPVAKPIITGINSACEGSEIRMTVANYPGQNLTWITPKNEKFTQPELVLKKASANASGNYKVYAESNGCTATGNIFIHIKTLPVIELGRVEEICQFAPSFFLTADIRNEVKGKGIFTGEVITPSGEIKTGKDGEYPVVYSFKTTEGCIGSANTVLKIKPGIMVNAGNDMNLLKDAPVQLKAITTGKAVTINWTNITGPESTALNPFVKPALTTSYTITVANSWGCVAKDEVVVKISPVFVSNAITPNGDGINDRWEIPDLRNYPNCQVTVFDIFGKQVFSSKGYSTPWDARLNGSTVPSGTYYYNIDLKDRVQQAPLKGWVLVKR